MTDAPGWSTELACHFREVLVAHADDPVTGTCVHCGAPRCRTWVSAYDNLAAAGEPMAVPERWEGRPSLRRETRE
jgi:hypothetical protein